MSETLLPYFERELNFLRQLTDEFSRRYPNAARRLRLPDLEQDPNADPHVERVLESFALLAGRLHEKLDDEFPELTDALLNILYPHFLAPIPSMAVVQFELDPARGQLPEGFLISKSSKLHSQPVDEVRCRYRTAYPVTLWPIQLTEARFQPPPFPRGLELPAKTAAILRLQFQTQAEMPLSELALDRLRFYLSGDPFLIPHLYECLFNNVIQVVIRPPEPDTSPVPVRMRPAECLFPVGFKPDEGLLPYPERSRLGYRLLTEMFVYPQKFLFVDIGGWQKAIRAGFTDKVEMIFALDRTMQNLERRVDASMFALGCSPIVNLFEQEAERISLTDFQQEYRIVPDETHPMGMEVYSVDEVVSTDADSGETTRYPPFHSFRHRQAEGSQLGFWHMARQSSLQTGDRGTDVYLNLVDLNFARLELEGAALEVRATCTNRDLPAQLQSIESLRFELEAATPLRRIRCLHGPTVPLRPPRRRGRAWRLISHLNPNHLSLSGGAEGLQALRDILSLYDFSDPDAGQQQLASFNRRLIEGIVSMSARRVVGNVGGEMGSGFCRGIEVTLEFDEEQYIGTGVFLFASVLERFLGVYASVNSFCQLVGKKADAKDCFKKWPPRSGQQSLV